MLGPKAETTCIDVLCAGIYPQLYFTAVALVMLLSISILSIYFSIHCFKTIEDFCLFYALAFMIFYRVPYHIGYDVFISEIFETFCVF